VCETNHSLPPSAKVKNAWSHTSTPPTPTWRGTYLSTETNLPLTFRKYIKIKTNDAYKIAENTFGNSVFSKLESFHY